MTESSYSISLSMVNLILGLVKNSYLLRPYSTTFHDKLGYKIFQFELKFRLSTSEIVKPDVIVYSTTIGNTLIFEWTEGSKITGRKRNQNDHYSHITVSDLINIAAIPPSAAKLFDITLVVRSEFVDVFSTELMDNEILFPILGFSQNLNGTIILKKEKNTFKEKQTDSFFTKGIKTNRIPKYVRFSLEANQPKDIVTYIVQDLVSLLIKGTDRITLEDFCRGLLLPWDLIGSEKQKEFSRLVNSILKELAKRKWGSQLIKRDDEYFRAWKLDPILYDKNKRGYRKYFNNFISEISKETYQLGFDF